MYTIITATGIAINRGQGLVAVATRTQASISNVNWIEKRKHLRNKSSKQLISFENRLRILPTGFESKNKTGAFRIAITILSWRHSEHLKEAHRKPNARNFANKNVPSTREP